MTKTIQEPLRITTVALDGPAGPPAMRERDQGKRTTKSQAWFFELGFLAERGCLTEEALPRKAPCGVARRELCMDILAG